MKDGRMSKLEKKSEQVKLKSVTFEKTRRMGKASEGEGKYLDAVKCKKML